MSTITIAIVIMTMIAMNIVAIIAITTTIITITIFIGIVITNTIISGSIAIIISVVIASTIIIAITVNIAMIVGIVAATVLVAIDIAITIIIKLMVTMINITREARKTLPAPPRRGPKGDGRCRLRNPYRKQGTPRLRCATLGPQPVSQPGAIQHPTPGKACAKKRTGLSRSSCSRWRRSMVSNT